MYSLLRPLLFKLDPEFTHKLTLSSLEVAAKTGLLSVLYPRIVPNPVKVMGIEFPNPVGLAAGLDKDGDHIDALGKLGFGFVEIGTVTPRPQAGNETPRLFRLPEYQAIINRMGFNNQGVEHLVEQVKQRKFSGVLGINIGKNATTPVENAIDDYRLCLQKVYEHADYITVNISSPNTPGLRSLQFGAQLQQLLSEIKIEQQKLSVAHGRYVPIAVKIAPDMNDEDLEGVAETLVDAGMDGVIATNTTLDRSVVENHTLANEAGGLSGAPLTHRSTEVIAKLSQVLRDRIPIIGVGGIVNGESACEKIVAGASLVQLYTGLIYRGPGLVSEAADAIASLSRPESAQA